MDQLQATPRNAFFGGLADFLAASTSPQRTQQMRGLMEFLQVPDIAKTLDRVSYGEPLTTGRGMTTKLRPEAENTLMAALGMIPAGKPAEAGAMALGRAGERVAERVVPQVMSRGGLTAEMLSAMAQGTQSPATVFHGTPHRFTKFDSSKIGTGEGNQSYGYGLYLAENPNVAKSYQSTLSGYSADGAKLPSDIGAVVGAFDGDVSKAIASRKEQLKKWTDSTSDKKHFIVKGLENEIKRLSELKGKKIESTGSLMQVDLPDQQIAKMLNWDEPMNEKEMISLYESLDKVDPRFAMEFQDSWYRMNESTGKGLDGQDVYMALMNNLKTPQSVAQTLKDAGIPGIRYLDQGSRGTGQGTSNFVVFPGMEDMLRIEQINNQPVESLFRSLGR
jgi:hypothetical protein